MRSQFPSSRGAAPGRLIALALAALAVALAAALFAGGTEVDWRGFAAGDATARAIVLDLRLPRVLLAALVGAGLAVAGAMMQAMFRNPLADPALIGVSSGAALGAAGAIVLGAGSTAAGVGLFGAGGAALGAGGGSLLGTSGALLGASGGMAPGAGAVVVAGIAAALPLLPLAAFAGALSATGLLLLFAHRDTVSTLLLAGVAFNALAGAAIGALTWLADDARLRNLTFWLLGSFGNADWTMLAGAAPLLLLPVLAAARLARPLNALLLGEIEAGYLGFPIARLKLALVVLAALAVGAAVACAGVIGFVGLVVPHIVRALTGPDHRRVLPGSALAGATLTVGADLAARTLAAPAELPVGVLLAALGAPFFLWLLKRQTGR